MTRSTTPSRRSPCTRRAEYQAGQADALNNIGWYHAQLGKHDQALTYCRQALDTQRRLDNRHGEADAWDSIGYAHHQLGQHAEAIDAYREALDRYRADGDRYGKADVLTHLGEAHHAVADPMRPPVAGSRPFASSTISTIPTPATSGPYSAPDA